MVWESYRDSHCTSTSNIYAGDSLQEYVVAECKVKLARRRLHSLDEDYQDTLGIINARSTVIVKNAKQGESFSVGASPSLRSFRYWRLTTGEVRLKALCLVLFLTALAGCVGPEKSIEYTLSDLIQAPWLRIQVAPTFEAPEQYEVNRHDPHLLIYTQYSGSGGYDWGKKHKVIRVPLTLEQHEKTKSLADAVLREFPRRDEVVGFDGTTWVFESSIYQYTKLAAWTPEHNTADRGYVSLLELRDYLHGLVDDYQLRNK